jgi:hypothetical protein
VRLLPAAVALTAVALAACRSHASQDELVTWARHIRAMPGRTACATEHDHPAGLYGEFDPERGICFIRPSLIPADIGAFGATYVTLEWNERREPFVQLDFGGGFIEAHGVRIDATGVHPFHAEEQ